MSGVRARLAVSDPPNCPVADVATGAATDVDDVSWTRETEDGRIVEEFHASAEPTAENGDGDADLDRVFTADGEAVYRLTRDPDANCPCEVVESLGCPVDDISVDGDTGTLHISLYLSDVAALRSVVDDLDSMAGGVELRYLVRDGEADEADEVLVDRGRLTDRQREVIETAYRMGYFEYPRESNAETVADELGVGVSTFAEHLAAAQSRLLTELFTE
ncbi:MAG: helix-turn-helix domain-containing protein [Halolamina sp.]